MAKWLITGASGLLGYHACHFLLEKGHKVTGLSHNHDINVDGVDERKVDLMDFQATCNLISDVMPDFILHCAAMTNVDACENDPELTYKHHVELSQSIAQAASHCGAKMVHITTDQLWDGTKAQICEDEAVNPLNVYGQTKADSETAVISACLNALIIRTNFFGKGRPWRLSFSDWLDKELKNGKTINGFNDIFYSPIAISFLLQAIYDLVEKDEKGVFHVAGKTRISKFDFIKLYAESAGYDVSLIHEQSSDLAKLNAKRPLDMSLSVEKVEKTLGRSMPTAQQSIENVLNQNEEYKQRKVS